MSLAHEETITPALHDEREAPYYVITLYTWIKDRDTATDLAVRISESLGSIEQVDKFSTTVSVEEGSAAEPERVYADLVLPR